MTAPTPSEDVAITQAICDGTIADYIDARVAEAKNGIWTNAQVGKAMAEAVRDQMEADAKIASDLCGRCTKDLCSCCRIADAIRARGKRLGRDMTDSTDWNVE